MSFEEKVIMIIRDNLEDHKDIPISTDMELAKDLGVDSLNALMILFGLEKEFSISLDESEFARIKTVKDVLQNLSQKYPRLQGN